MKNKAFPNKKQALEKEKSKKISFCPLPIFPQAVLQQASKSNAKMRFIQELINSGKRDVVFSAAYAAEIVNLAHASSFSRVTSELKQANVIDVIPVYDSSKDHGKGFNIYRLADWFYDPRFRKLLEKYFYLWWLPLALLVYIDFNEKYFHAMYKYKNMNAKYTVTKKWGYDTPEQDWTWGEAYYRCKGILLTYVSKSIIFKKNPEREMNEAISPSQDSVFRATGLCKKFQGTDVDISWADQFSDLPF
jgi:hypothetical protein